MASNTMWGTKSIAGSKPSGFDAKVAIPTMAGSTGPDAVGNLDKGLAPLLKSVKQYVERAETNGQSHILDAHDINNPLLTHLHSTVHSSDYQKQNLGTPTEKPTPQPA